jgi:hypothetical protein
MPFRGGCATLLVHRTPALFEFGQLRLLNDYPGSEYHIDQMRWRTLRDGSLITARHYLEIFHGKWDLRQSRRTEPFSPTDNFELILPLVGFGFR